MKKFFLTASIIVLTLTTYSQSDSIHKHAKQLLQLTGSEKLGVLMMNTMIASFKKDLSTVPDKFWDEFAKEFNPDELIALLVPIYVKNYSDDELIKLIAFYNTPLGQKVIEKTPLIAQESYSAGQEWGKKIGEKVTARLISEGYINKS